MKLRLSQGVTYRSALEGTQGAGERDPKAAEPLRTALFSPEVGNTSCPSSGCSTVTQRKGEETWLAGEVAHPDLLYLPRCLRGCELPVLGPGIPSADVPGHQEHVHRELPPPAPQAPPSASPLRQENAPCLASRRGSGMKSHRPRWAVDSLQPSRIWKICRSFPGSCSLKQAPRDLPCSEFTGSLSLPADSLFTETYGPDGLDLMGYGRAQQKICRLTSTWGFLTRELQPEGHRAHSFRLAVAELPSFMARG